MGAKQAQFLTLASMDGDFTPEGRMLSAKLLHYLIEQSRVPIVLGQLPDTPVEPYLNLMGPKVGQAFRKQLSPPASADLVILGSYLASENRIRLNIQVIQVATGRILLATDDEFKNDWPREKTLVAQAPSKRTDEALVLGQEEPQNLVAREQEQINEKLRGLQQEVLDVKARYWALRIHLEGGSLAGKLKPWEVIQDKMLRKVFEEKVNYWVTQDKILPLQPDELKQMQLADDKAFGLVLGRMP